MIALNARARAIFDQAQRAIFIRTDRLFAALMTLQWMAAIGAACWISPRTWIGSASFVHFHVWAAAIFGGILTAFPVALVFLLPGSRLTRHTIAAEQMLISGLLIFLTGGRI